MVPKEAPTCRSKAQRVRCLKERMIVSLWVEVRCCVSQLQVRNFTDEGGGFRGNSGGKLPGRNTETEEAGGDEEEKEDSRERRIRNEITQEVVVGNKETERYAKTTAQ